MEKLLILMSFMTRIPVKHYEYDEEKLGSSMALFPILGMIIALILFVLSKIFQITFQSQFIVAILICLLEIIITGGLHIDGLADTFDAIYSYRSKEKMLEIMKDSRIGTNGLLAVLFYTILKIGLLSVILRLNHAGIILVYPVISRLCSLASCNFSPYARENGMGKAFIKYTTNKDLIIMTLISICYIFFFCGFSNIFMKYLASFIGVSLMLAFSYLFSKYMEKKIGGITGDTLGALLELSELIYIALFYLIII